VLGAVLGWGLGAQLVEMMDEQLGQTSVRGKETELVLVMDYL